MINYLSVLNTVAANSADVVIDNQGNLAITGIANVIPAVSVNDVQIIPASAEQIQRQLLTFTSANSTQYSFTIQGYAMGSGAATNRLVQFTSAASATATTIAQQAINAVNALSDFNVTALAADGSTTANNGTIILVAKTATSTCPYAPVFAVAEADANIALTTFASATAAAAPTGGRTAQLEPIINTSGVMTGIRIIDGGEGYLAAPAITIANGGGSGSSAPTATSIIFEGAVVGIAFTAGTSYTYNTYKGFQVVGTGTALKTKYGYVSNTALAAAPPQYASLASLVDGTSYTEVIISYSLAPIMGVTTFSMNQTTGQISVCIAQSATNASDLIAGWGTFANLRKGMKTNFLAAVALDGTTAVTTTTYVVATGVLTLSAACSTGIESGDIILAGTTPAFGNTADTNAVAKVLGVASNTSLVCQIGGGNLIAAITTQTLATRVVRRSTISR